MLLEMRHVVVHYEKAEALKGVSINVVNGEIVTIIGSNGAGKSTTLKSIAALIHPTSGEIWFDGHRVDTCRPEEMVKKGVSICMEGRRLFPFMTVLENLQMGAFCRRDKTEIGGDIGSVFDLFPVLRERKKQKAGSLSGGEQQMLTIGRALMSGPKLLLLDEPSLGLAPKIVTHMAKTAKELNKRGLSILLVEQNAQMALRIAHRGYLMEVGEIVLAGEAQSLYGNDYVRRAYLGT